MICPICKCPVRTNKCWTINGVPHHKGCASWRQMPTHIRLDDGTLKEVEVVKLNVRSARVRIKGENKTIRVRRSTRKLRTLK